jgi:hypothetical protein
MQYPMIAQPQYGFAPTMPMMANGGSVADAQSVQSKGRGRDTMLVHMTPKEVGGLQALAMQHGGSLTVNPQTGLPEAGFLEAILPTLAGAALTIGSGGVINPYMSAAIVGGVQTARTGDLGQGLLAGLGAYGGAGLGAGLTALLERVLLLPLRPPLVKQHCKHLLLPQARQEVVQVVLYSLQALLPLPLLLEPTLFEPPFQILALFQRMLI